MTRVRVSFSISGIMDPSARLAHLVLRGEGVHPGRQVQAQQEAKEGGVDAAGQVSQDGGPGHLRLPGNFDLKI